MQIRDALAYFVVQLQADGRSANTVAQYQRHIGQLLMWMGANEGGVAVEDIDHQVLARFLASPVVTTKKDGSPKKQTSINALRSSLRAFFGYLHDAGYAACDHGRLIRRAQASSAPPRWLDEEKQKKLLEVLRGEDGGRDYALFATLLLAGLRIGEALALRAEDVDLQRMELRLRRTKAGADDRFPLSKSLAAVLGPYVQGRKLYMFEGPSGRPLTARHARRQLRQWLERAGLPTLSPHGLRHSFAMSLYRRTKDPLLVQRALRHRSVVSTAVYARPSESRLRAAIGG